VAVCHSCGRALCLRCAVPVRGDVYGRECLTEVLGPDGTEQPRAVPARARDLVLDLAGLGLAVCVIATLLPWTRFGVGSGMSGAWGIVPPRWSTLAAGGASLGLIAWVPLLASGGAVRRGGSIVLGAFSACALAGTVLHVLNPPPFTHAWVGPWVALGGGTIALGATAFALLRASRTASIP
jgi:hypothetical protein